MLGGKTTAEQLDKQLQGSSNKRQWNGTIFPQRSWMDIPVPPANQGYNLRGLGNFTGNLNPLEVHWSNTRWAYELQGTDCWHQAQQILLLVCLRAHLESSFFSLQIKMEFPEQIRIGKDVTASQKNVLTQSFNVIARMQEGCRGFQLPIHSYIITW